MGDGVSAQSVYLDGPAEKENSSSPAPAVRAARAAGAGTTEPARALDLPADWEPPADADPARVAGFKAFFAPGAAAYVRTPGDDDPTHYTVEWDRTFARWNVSRPAVYVERGSRIRDVCRPISGAP